MVASETGEFKHMHQINEKEVFSLVFKELLTQANKGHHQTFPW